MFENDTLDIPILLLNDVLPVSIWGHSALDDDDLPRVQASRYGPCVWDHLRWRVDVRALDTCNCTHAAWSYCVFHVLAWAYTDCVISMTSSRPVLLQLLQLWYRLHEGLLIIAWWHQRADVIIIISLLPDSGQCVSHLPQTSGFSCQTTTCSVCVWVSVCVCLR